MKSGAFFSVTSESLHHIGRRGRRCPSNQSESRDRKRRHFEQWHADQSTNEPVNAEACVLLFTFRDWARWEELPAHTSHRPLFWNLAAAAALPSTTTISDERWKTVEDRYELLPTPAEALDLFGMLVVGVGRKVLHRRLVLTILSISKSSQLVLLLRTSSLLLLFAPSLLTFLLLQAPCRKNCTPVVVARSVCRKRT